MCGKKMKQKYCPLAVALVTFAIVPFHSTYKKRILCHALSSRPNHSSCVTGTRVFSSCVTTAGNEIRVKKSREESRPIRRFLRSQDRTALVFTSQKFRLFASSSEENEVLTTETVSSSRISLKDIVLSSFATITLGSLSYYYFQGEENSFSLSTLGHDLGMGLVATVLAGLFVIVWTTLVKVGVLDPRDSRKIIHTGSAPLFLLLWPFFSAAPWSRFFAATVPFINVFRLYAAGSTDSMQRSEEELANAVSRSGNAKEALGGPLVYVLIMLIATLVFWRDNMTGVMALSTMAAGDGVSRRRVCSLTFMKFDELARDFTLFLYHFYKLGLIYKLDSTDG